MHKILCIGTCSDIKRNRFTGQSVMFDGVVNHLKKHGVVVGVIDISQKIQRGGVLARTVDYAIILVQFFVKLLVGGYNLCYITTSQSKNGFLRDNAMITMCRWFKVPVITHQYGANYHQLLDALGASGTSRLIKMLDYVSIIIVEGDYMKEQYSFLPNYQLKVISIPNGLPIEGRHAMVPKTYDGNHPFVMFYLSNLIWSKGYFDVLQAVDILVNREHLDVKCVFAGNFIASNDDEFPGIANKEDFDNFISEHSLTERVEYYSGLYGEEKDRYFYKSNVFLLPSYYINEGQPVSIIEAMAYGCVPLVTEYRHIPMMINEQNGCFVNPKDAEDIAQKVKSMIEHPDVYAAKSRQSIIDYQEKFKFEVYAGKVMDCINSVIS
jgi:glycosyltransferase involved in cell wall biosynthesis